MAEMVTKLCKGCQQIKPAWKTRSTYCTDCCLVHNREWARRHPEKIKARTKEQAHDPDHQQKTSTYRKIKRRTETEFRAKEILKNREAKLLRAYGMTIAQYHVLLEAQDGCCAICGEANEVVIRMGRRVGLGVDHDHVTGKVRALLCNMCNSGIGMFRDEPMRLWRAIQYLRDHGREWVTQENLPP